MNALSAVSAVNAVSALNGAAMPVGAERKMPLLGFGQVRHARLKPVRNAFVYGTYFLMLPMRSLSSKTGRDGASALAYNRPGALSFFDCDHGDGRGPEAGGALAWLEALLESERIDGADGEIWLHCYPRVLGYTFKPVSFWYCHREDGSLRAIVVEVNNTFGERHCYLLDAPRFGVELRADKVFHVSPFCPVEGSYRFRFMVTGDHRRTVACIDYDDAAGPLLQTSVSGALEPLTHAAIRRALWSYPAMTLMVIARIHWQAAKLFFKRAPFFGKPLPPASFTSR
jgi:DUF1365 family protein